MMTVCCLSEADNKPISSYTFKLFQYGTHDFMEKLARMVFDMVVQLQQQNTSLLENRVPPALSADD